MAKLNIELNLEDLGDYFDEESGALDFESFMSDEIQSQISAKIVSRIEAEQIKKIEQKISESLEGLVSKLESKLDEKVNEVTENLLNRNITIYDRYGDVVKKDVNILEMFKKKMDNFLTEKVDNNGKTGGHNSNQTRIDYLVNKNIGYSMESKVEETMRKLFIVFKDGSKITYTFRRAYVNPMDYFKRHAKSSMKSAILQQYPKKDNPPIDLLAGEENE